MTNRLLVYVDVDDTMVRSFGSKRIPMGHVVEHVRQLHREGAELYCWSSGGAQYSRESAEELGIAELFRKFLGKPHVFLDDVAPADWPRCVVQHPSGVRGMSLGEYEAAVQPGTRPASGHAEVTRFAEVARGFVRFVRSASDLAMNERVSQVTKLFTRLYGAALVLPDLDPGSAPDPEVVEMPKEWPGFGDRDVYHEFFDPYDGDNPVCGSLSDDVLDTFRDLSEGLQLFDAGYFEAAAWHWSFTFVSHWGAHVVDGLRALHRIR